MLTACAARGFWCLPRPQPWGPQALGVGNVTSQANTAITTAATTTTTTTTSHKNTYEYYAFVQMCTFSVLLALFFGVLLYIIVAPVYQFTCLPFYTKHCRSTASHQQAWERKVALFKENQATFNTCRKLTKDAKGARNDNVRVIKTQPDADGKETDEVLAGFNTHNNDLDEDDGLPAGQRRRGKPWLENRRIATKLEGAWGSLPVSLGNTLASQSQDEWVVLSLHVGLLVFIAIMELGYLLGPNMIHSSSCVTDYDCFEKDHTLEFAFDAASARPADCSKKYADGLGWEGMFGAGSNNTMLMCFKDKEGQWDIGRVLSIFGVVLATQFALFATVTIGVFQKLLEARRAGDVLAEQGWPRPWPCGSITDTVKEFNKKVKQAAVEAKGNAVAKAKGALPPGKDSESSDPVDKHLDAYQLGELEKLIDTQLDEARDRGMAMYNECTEDPCLWTAQNITHCVARYWWFCWLVFCAASACGVYVYLFAAQDVTLLQGLWIVTIHFYAFEFQGWRVYTYHNGRALYRPPASVAVRGVHEEGVLKRVCPCCELCPLDCLRQCCDWTGCANPILSPGSSHEARGVCGRNQEGIRTRR